MNDFRPTRKKKSHQKKNGQPWHYLGCGVWGEFTLQYRSQTIGIIFLVITFVDIHYTTTISKRPLRTHTHTNNNNSFGHITLIVSGINQTIIIHLFNVRVCVTTIIQCSIYTYIFAFSCVRILNEQSLDMSHCNGHIQRVIGRNFMGFVGEWKTTTHTDYKKKIGKNCWRK